MFGFGAAIAGSLKAPYEEAKKLEMAKTAFRQMNLSTEDNATAFASAASLAHKQLGSTITENIELIQDLHTSFGDLHHALEFAPDFQKFATMAKIMNHGKSVDGLVQNSAKALEHRGDKVTQNLDEFRSELSMMSQVYLATKGRVNANDYFVASQRGKVAYQMADKDFLYGAFAGLIQQMTGATAGTSLMTMNSSLIGGHMDNKAKGFLADLGLWTTNISPIQKQINAELAKLSAKDRKELGLTKNVAMTGGLTEQAANLAAHNADRFVKEILVPAMHAKFGNVTNDQMIELIAKHFNRATADILGKLISSQKTLDKDTANFRKSNDFRSGYAEYIKSPEGAEVAADAAWRNFLAVFGSVYLPTITKGLLKLAGGLDSLAQFVERNPGPVKVLAYALLGLAGTMMFGGTVNLLAASMRGLSLALGMQAIGGIKGIAGISAALNGASKFSLVGAIGALANPIGIAVLALGTLAAAFYAFSPLTQEEIDDKKDQGGASLTPGAQKRVDAGELGPNVRTGSGASKGGKVGDVHIDGKKAGELIAPHMAKAASAPGNSSTFDFTMGQATAGMAY